MGSAGNELVPQQPTENLIPDTSAPEIVQPSAALDPRLVDWHTQMFLEQYEKLKSWLEERLYIRFGNIDVSEIVDITLFEAWSRLGQFRGRPSTDRSDITWNLMRGWVSGIAYNQVRMHFRSRHTYGNSSLDEMMLDPHFKAPIARDAIDEALERIHNSAMLNLLLENAELTPKQQKVLVARYIHELSPAETAEALSMEAGTVRGLAFRALLRLKRTALELGLEPW